MTREQKVNRIAELQSKIADIGTEDFSSRLNELEERLITEKGQQWTATRDEISYCRGKIQMKTDLDAELSTLQSQVEN